MKLKMSWRFNIKGEAVFWIVSLMFISVGVLFTYGVPKIISIDTELCTQKTAGNVVELFKTEKDYYYPVFEFSDKEGKVIKKKSGSGSNIPAFNKGDSVEIFYNPANPDDFFVPGENDDLLYAFKMIGLVFLILGISILLLTLPSIMIKIKYPQNTDFWFWWVNFVGGMMGALLFSLPSTFIWAIYLLLPDKAQAAFSGKFFLLWIFTAVGLLVNAGIFFIAKSQLKGRPVWKNS